MKKILLALLLLALSVSAQTKSNALGLWLQGGNSGEHWGMDWKHKLNPTTATDLYFRLYSSDHETSLGAYLGYYFHNYNVIKLDASAGRMPLYWGPYGGFGYWSEDWNDNNDDWDVTGLAIRFGVVGGIAWELPASVPIEFWMELNPLAEFQNVSWDAPAGQDDSDTHWEIPELYFRLGLRAWFF